METETEEDDSGVEIMRAEVIAEENWSEAERFVSLDTRDELPSLVTAENSANSQHNSRLNSRFIKIYQGNPQLKYIDAVINPQFL